MLPDTAHHQTRPKAKALSSLDVKVVPELQPLPVFRYFGSCNARPTFLRVLVFLHLHLDTLDHSHPEADERYEILRDDSGEEFGLS